jgi:tetratricopeptide (TPR) repeat protein
MSKNKTDKPTVFISYSHKDEEWKDRLLPHLRMLELAGFDIDIWDDRDIDAGAQWFTDIKQAMDRAAVAVCLISADYLASDFCMKEEIPYLLGRRKRDGMALLAILVRPCLWEACHWLKDIQMLPRDGKSVAVDFKDNYDEVFRDVAKFILVIVGNPNYRPPAPALPRQSWPKEIAEALIEILDNPDYRLSEPSPPQWSPPKRIEISRLPVTGAELFGRRKELELLDEAWAKASTHVVSLVAWGGVGKSTLVNKWLEQMVGENYRGARRVYAWSFYSQGTGERVTSADQFINAALQWFGDTDPTAGSPWDKGERLARLVQAEKTLLLLDGLEPLQSLHAHERGKIKDPALLTLLLELAHNNPGLCLITTREPVSDLAEFVPSVLHKDLEQISDEAGRALLRVGGVQGTDAELEQATRAFGNHALAINLLAVYLRDVPGHHVSYAAEIPDLDIPEAAGKHPRRLMAAFAQRFGDGPEVELLHLLGLFDHPADNSSLRALRRAPVIHGLTDHIRKLTDANWLRAVDTLRQYRLIAPQSQHRPDDLDAHPLVREHFGQQLKQKFPDACREGNDRLFEHLRSQGTGRGRGKKFPDTVEEMSRLYEAVIYGCRAARYRDAFVGVYYKRIQRGQEFFSANMLGTVSADLAALSYFFANDWQQPIDKTEGRKIEGRWRALLLGQAGNRLLMLGRLKEAVAPMQEALKADIARKAWKYASVDADNLAIIHMILGDLSQASLYSEKDVRFARDSRDAKQRVSALNTQGDVLHQRGLLFKAEAAFRQSEGIKRSGTKNKRSKRKGSKRKKLRDRGRHVPSSLLGHRYHDLLLSQGKYAEVQGVVERILETHSREGFNLIDVALLHLSQGRALLLQASREGAEHLADAEAFLNKAMHELLQTGLEVPLPRGLLARAELYRVKGEFERAQADLDETMRIATRGSMGLHEADCHLEYARLYLALSERQNEPKIKQEQREKAREHWTKANEMIERMGYHRRDKDVQEIEAELAQAS